MSTKTRYSDAELEEFRAIIKEKLEKARANAKPGSLASKANMVKNFNENK